MGGQLSNQAPPRHVLDAFGASEQPQIVPGGQGRTWRAGALALKQVSNIVEAEWLGGLLDRLPESGFQIARPQRASGGSWVVESWVASHWVQGTHDRTRWEDALQTCRALSRMLATTERPAFLTDRSTVWDAGDRAAWAAPDPVVHHSEMEPLVSAFSTFRRPCRDASQVIHGDLTGNIMFAEQGDPVVLDFAVYWRPAAFAEAIIVADALAFHEAPAGLATRISSQSRSMLARACIYRLITSDAYASRSKVDQHYIPMQVASFSRVLAICAQLPEPD